MKSSIQTPLNKVRGLGAAGEGTEHFWLQRVTAVANVVLGICFAFFLFSNAGVPLAEYKASVGNPFVAAMLILFIVSGTVHMRLGMQVIIEDYIHGEGAKVVAVIANTFFCAAVGLIGVLAVAKIAVGG